jgi:hypothetical protein
MFFPQAESIVDEPVTSRAAPRNVSFTKKPPKDYFLYFDYIIFRAKWQGILGFCRPFAEKLLLFLQRVAIISGEQKTVR